MSKKMRAVYTSAELYGEWKNFNQMISSIREKFEEITPEEYRNSCNLSFSGDEFGVNLVITYNRPETDAEKQARLNMEEAYKESRRQTFLKLKQEFESDETP